MPEPALSQTFAHLGAVRRSSAAVDIADASAECDVAVTKHAIGAHVVLQFDITSRCVTGSLCSNALTYLVVLQHT